MIILLNIKTSDEVRFRDDLDLDLSPYVLVDLIEFILRKLDLSNKFFKSWINNFFHSMRDKGPIGAIIDFYLEVDLFLEENFHKFGFLVTKTLKPFREYFLIIGVTVTVTDGHPRGQLLGGEPIKMFVKQ
jgi:hypothetical protein